MYQLLTTPEPTGKRGRPLLIGPRPQPPLRTEQFCRLCKQTLPADCFYRVVKRHGGLSDLCKTCNTLHASRRNWAGMHRKGTLQKLIEDTEARVAEMKRVMLRMIAGEDWWGD